MEKDKYHMLFPHIRENDSNEKQVLFGHGYQWEGKGWSE
jgi:hypothetical protein